MSGISICHIKNLLKEERARRCISFIAGNAIYRFTYVQTQFSLKQINISTTLSENLTEFLILQKSHHDMFRSNKFISKLCPDNYCSVDYLFAQFVISDFHLITLFQLLISRGSHYLLLS